MAARTNPSPTDSRSSWRATASAARAMCRSSLSLSGSLILTEPGSARGAPARRGPDVASARDLLPQPIEDVDRHGKDDGRVLLRGDLRQGLQIAQLQRGRVGRDHLGGLGELRRRLELALGVDDLGALLAL